MNKKACLLLTASLVTGTVFADGIVVGPVEPTAMSPVVTGYNSIASGANTTVNATNSVALGRDNTVAGDDTIVIGGGNGTVLGSQSTVIGYNNRIDGSMEQTVIGANSTTAGQGATVIGTHATVTAWDAVGIGNNIIADKANSVAIGTNSVTDDAVGVDGITINGTRHVFAGEQPSAVVSFGAQGRPGAGGVQYYNRQLQNVSAGRVQADSLDAVNGSQLFAVADEVTNNGNQIATNKQNIADTVRGLAMLGDIVNDHDQAIVNNTNNINNLGHDVAQNRDAIGQLQPVVADHENRITALENRSLNATNAVNNRINGVEKRMNRLGASSASLAGLHPLDFNKDDKASYAVSYGHYRNANAVAIGAFYRPNERVMIGLGASLGAENQYTANVAFKFGPGSDYLAEAKDKDARISKLENLVNQLLADRK